MNILKKLSIIVFVLSVIATSFTTNAVENDFKSRIEKSPYKLLAKVGGKLFDDIALLSAQERVQPEVMRVLIHQDLMPYIDYRYAAYKILGKYVKTASKQQRAEFVEVMRHYLENTYAQALTQYKNQQVKFEGDKDTGNKRIAVVHSEIVQQGSSNIRIEFKFRKNRKTGQWKAFDMVVEGISLLNSKQAEITRQIREHGLDEVIAQIRDKTNNA